MKKILLFFNVIVIFSSFADDGINCEQKNNYLVGLTSDFYKAVEITVMAPLELRDEAQVVYMAEGDILTLTDTLVHNPQTLEFKLVDKLNQKDLPSLIFKSKDIYDSTISELEKGGLLAVNCDAIAIEDHTSQYGRWYAEFKLRKKSEDDQTVIVTP